jgi:hypothetical protein
MDFWSEENPQKTRTSGPVLFQLFNLHQIFFLKLPLELVTKDFPEKKHQSCQISRENIPV